MPKACVENEFSADGALELSDFAELFGTSPEAISPTCRAMIKAGDFRYRRLVGVERDRMLVDVLKRLDSDPVSTARPDALDRWEQGWGENLVEYERSGGDERFLVPKYIRPGQPLRQTRLFKMIKAGRPVVFGDGENLRSMSYIENTVRGLILAAKSEKSNGQTYWIADERPYRTIEIYETVARLLEVKNFKPRFLPNVVPDALRLTDRVLQAVNLYQMEVHVAGEMNQDIACSIHKAKRELGYAPQIALEEGMRRSLQWCRENGVDL